MQMLLLLCNELISSLTSNWHAYGHEMPLAKRRNKMSTTSTFDLHIALTCFSDLIQMSQSKLHFSKLIYKHTRSTP